MSRRMLSVMAFLWALLLGSVSFAQTPSPSPSELAARLDTPAARDMIDPRPQGITLDVPELPSGYSVVVRDTLTIAWPERMDPLVRSTVAHAADDARAVASQLGLATLPAVQIRLVPDVETMRALAPRNAPPPAYAVGVAYPTERLVLVSASAPNTREASNLRQVLRHELSHVLLGAATGDAAIPRWLSEGIAVEQAGEHSMERFEELAIASFTGKMLPLRRLDSAFSSGPSEVNVAYAQSADFVSYLLRTEGVSRFAILLSHLRAGLTLDEAVHETYGATLSRVEEEWRHDAASRFALAPLWAGTSAAWMLGALALVIGAVKRRKKSRETLARWAFEEKRRDDLKIVYFRPTSWTKRADAPGETDEEVPRIALDGEKHTLH